MGQFWTDLDRVLDAISRHVKGDGFKITEVMGMTDVDGLFQQLVEAHLFREMLQEGNEAAVSKAMTFKR